MRSAILRAISSPEVGALERRVSNEASAWELRVTVTQNKRPEHTLDRAPRIRIRQLREHVRCDGVPIAVEYRKEQPLLVAERAVETAAIDAGRFDEVIDRSCFVALGPEQRHRAIKNLTTVKLFNACHCFCSCWNDYYYTRRNWSYTIMPLQTEAKVISSSSCEFCLD